MTKSITHYEVFAQSLPVAINGGWDQLRLESFLGRPLEADEITEFNLATGIRVPISRRLQNIPTKGVKDDSNKPSVELIPNSFIRGLGGAFKFGADKYGKHNFKLGLEHTRALAAAIRHIYAIIDGEDMDPESGLPHIYHAGCSLAMYDYQRLNHPELDDRYKDGDK